MFKYFFAYRGIMQMFSPQKTKVGIKLRMKITSENVYKGGNTFQKNVGKYRKLQILQPASVYFGTFAGKYIVI